MTSISEILEFIHRRFPHDCNWLRGNCLWFALILKKRFPNVEIYYLPIKGHFVVGFYTLCGWRPRNLHIKKIYVDYAGLIDIDEEPWSLTKIQQEDKLLYNHIIRDCLL